MSKVNKNCEGQLKREGRMIRQRKKIGEILVERAFVTEDQIKNALQESIKKRKKLGEYLVDSKVIKEDELIDALSMQLRVRKYSADDFNSDSSIKNLIPSHFAYQNKICPIIKKGNLLLLAMQDPLDIGVIDKIESMTKMEVEVLICSKYELLKLLEKVYTSLVDENLAKENDGASQKSKIKEIAEVLIANIGKTIEERGGSKKLEENVSETAKQKDERRGSPSVQGLKQTLQKVDDWAKRQIELFEEARAKHSKKESERVIKPYVHNTFMKKLEAKSKLESNRRNKEPVSKSHFPNGGFNNEIRDRESRSEIHIPKCPTCGSEKVGRVSVAANVFWLGIFAPAIGKTFECENCGYKW